MYESMASSCLSVQTFKTKLKLESKVLDSARQKLIELQMKKDTEVLVTEVTEEEVAEVEVTEMEEETVNGLENGIVVARNVSLEAFLKYRGTGLKVSMRLLDGNIIIHEVPLGAHGEVVGEIWKHMVIWHNDLIVSGARDVIVDKNSVLRPDASIQPDQLPAPPVGQECDASGWVYPTLVVEVGSSEGLLSLHSLARKYFNQRTTIQIYLAIKIFGRRNDGTCVLVAFLYDRTSPNPERPIWVKSFGTAPMHLSAYKFFRRRCVPNQNITGFGINNAPPCNDFNIQIYQINIPTAAIFYGSTTVIPPNLVNGFNLDLYRLQRVALAY